ncbi:MAG: nuclear transport factor 2 family protein [Nitrospirae bacterium]|nr:nuclear transport factor 2 family protein [Nitrospirota bacterium]MBI3606279.1 nuclear transport factor 2 family protein [Nitrospirota bacterium]
MSEKNPITGKEEKKSVSAPIRALIEFYEAFNSRDIEKMSKNWAGTDEVVMSNPVGGIKRGWKEIKAVYDRIFNGSARVYVEFYDYTVHETGEIFYAIGRERGEFHAGETVMNLAIRTSRIFQLINGRWRQVHHHGSIDDPDLLARYQAAVKKV